ncbi:MAG: dTMP kinase [Deltaproteobacteria bacterium RIFCSPHIGHO2_02_FULL_50_15]|nr:MAG: dTMP kinase [Deltaproteobacteria bacterium RIFCSPHIGHO2_02_FULL_50_15]
MAGLFITFEGIEGTGKSTQARLLAQALKKKGYRVVLTREPGGTRLADRIRHLLLDRCHQGMSPLTELFLYEASRVVHVAETVRPALQRGAIVLCDRFTDATIAYQGYGRGLSLSLLKTLNQKATKNLQPDLTILLDCPPIRGLKRARGRNRRTLTCQDRFERESLLFHRRVRQGYLKLMRQNKKRFIKINALLPIQKTHQQILKKVEGYLS